MSNKLRENQAMSLFNVGHGNFVCAKRVITILESGPLPVKRLRERAHEANYLIDATAGRKTRSLIILDSQHIILSALAPQTIQERLENAQTEKPSWLSIAETEVREGELVS